jgi:hypothetical protein
MDNTDVTANYIFTLCDLNFSWWWVPVAWSEVTRWEDNIKRDY